jgi:capsid protein
LSEAALPYTIENVSRLIVHNTAEDKKAEARNFMSNIVSAKELFEVSQAKLVGGVAVLSVRESKTQTYTDAKTGEVKASLEKNLLSYKPKADAQQAVVKEMGGGTVVDDKTKLDIPF